mmetsp:Transcript_33336/g.87429  ORF Transcript_33336/g.87429 Transcript_33336/m.87429 type:complete len:109 (-) Transcript_33336:1723-2049(-)
MIQRQWLPTCSRPSLTYKTPWGSLPLEYALLWPLSSPSIAATAAVAVSIRQSDGYTRSKQGAFPNEAAHTTLRQPRSEVADVPRVGILHHLGTGTLVSAAPERVKPGF